MPQNKIQFQPGMSLSELIERFDPLRGALQPGPTRVLPAPQSRRKARKGRHDRVHAKASRDPQLHAENEHILAATANGSALTANTVAP